ncbi:uncharacterized protein [Palaemon carinicauda]|uniref:uncharacterized protein n=1 Tax=Palaemon carinicauda TaxID=392227 RepID=UPI0035B6AA73
MVFRGRQGSGSLTWFLLVVVSLVVVVGVHPSPYPAYEDHLPYQISQEDAPDDGSPISYNPDPHLSFPQELEFRSSNPDRFPQIFYDRRSDSNRNLQQILRSFPLVVGGPSPSDRVLPLSWSSLEEAAMAQQARGTGVSSNLSKGATLTQLTLEEPRPKRDTETIPPVRRRFCINWLKFCPFR